MLSSSLKLLKSSPIFLDNKVYSTLCNSFFFYQTYLQGSYTFSKVKFKNFSSIFKVHYTQCILYVQRAIYEASLSL